jgi:SAM-dependent methyltransferase
MASRKADLSVFPSWHCTVHRSSLCRGDSSLICAEGHSFPVTNGIPRFVSGTTYADAFGVQWNTYRTTQLDSYTGTTISRDRAARCMGPVWSSLAGKTVLECGCGAGRFTEVLLSRGAYVTSIDISTAVEANAKNCPLSAVHRIAQADIVNLPFAPRQYDVVFCLGVIQHTPWPKKAIRKLWEQVRPGGALVIDHYTYRWGWYLRTAPFFRAWLRRLPADEGLVWTERIVNTLLPLHRACRGSRLVTILLGRFSPVWSYYHIFPELRDELQRQLALLDTHDGLTDWYKHFYTRGQLRRVLEELGAKEIWCESGGNGVEARGRRPALPTG